MDSPLSVHVLDTVEGSGLKRSMAIEGSSFLSHHAALHQLLG